LLVAARHAPSDGPVILDLDASLVEIHSDNNRALPLISRAATGSIRCSVSQTLPVKPLQGSYAQGTHQQTMLLTC
jgi:hypothetical protein